MTSDQLQALLAELSEQQREAVLSTERITVVPACPGSGKTRLVAARFLWEVFRHNQSVAALSFTNVAEREIRGRVSPRAVITDHPHFAGTIDAFLLRYVVKPFGGNYINFRRFHAPVDEGEYRFQQRPVPGSHSRFALRHHSLVYDPSGHAFDLDKEQVSDRQRVQAVLALKKLAWQRGEVTYSDVCFIAASLLAEAHIRQVVLGRFPVLLIDEFQDTGGAREHCILSLLQDPHLIRSLVVGDPDQCIMEFTGARPGLIAQVMDMPGAHPVYLSETHRFHEEIARVVRPLAKQLQDLTPHPPVPEGGGSTVLLIHDYRVMDRDLSIVSGAFERFSSRFPVEPRQAGDSLRALLVWKQTTLARLKEVVQYPEFSCNWLRHFFDGFIALSNGQPYDCFREVERVLSAAVGFDASSPTLRELEHKGWDRRAWRRFVWHISSNVIMPASPDETIEQWISRLKTAIATQLDANGFTAEMVPSNIKLQRTKLGERVSHRLSDYVRENPTADASLLIEKVHQVKGREFHSVCYFVPTPAKGAVPVTQAWFGRIGTEESRVAYVAMTRARQALMVVIPRLWHDEMQGSAAGLAFIDSFTHVGNLGDYAS